MDYVHERGSDVTCDEDYPIIHVEDNDEKVDVLQYYMDEITLDGDACVWYVGEIVSYAVDSIHHDKVLDVLERWNELHESPMNSPQMLMYELRDGVYRVDIHNIRGNKLHVPTSPEFELNDDEIRELLMACVKMGVRIYDQTDRSIW